MFVSGRKCGANQSGVTSLSLLDSQNIIASLKNVPSSSFSNKQHEQSEFMDFSGNLKHHM